MSAEAVTAALAAVDRHNDRCMVCYPGPGECATGDRLLAEVRRALEADKEAADEHERGGHDWAAESADAVRGRIVRVHTAPASVPVFTSLWTMLLSA